MLFVLRYAYILPGIIAILYHQILKHMCLFQEQETISMCLKLRGAYLLFFFDHTQINFEHGPQRGCMYLILARWAALTSLVLPYAQMYMCS